MPSFDRRPATWSDLRDYFSRLHSATIDRVWFGDFLAMYLEIGRQVGVYPRSGLSMCERGIFVGYDWIMSTSSEGIIDRKTPEAEATLAHLLSGSKIECATSLGSSDIWLHFDNGCILESRGGSDWSLFESPDRYLSLDKGQPVIEQTYR